MGYRITKRIAVLLCFCIFFELVSPINGISSAFAGTNNFRTMSVNTSSNADKKVLMATISLIKGESIQLVVTVRPENASNKSLIWSSSEKEVVLVDKNGKITATGIGNANIIVKALDESGVQALCKVIVSHKNDENSGGGSTSGGGGTSGGGNSGGSATNNGNSDSMTIGQNLEMEYTGLTFTSPVITAGSWVSEYQRNLMKWKLQKLDGTMASSQWALLRGKWYLLDADEYMRTGWELVNSRWYYLNGDGSMVIGWVQINDKWYYLWGDGAMATGWVYVGEEWYYLSADGSMLVNTIAPDGNRVDRNGCWVAPSTNLSL